MWTSLEIQGNLPAASVLQNAVPAARGDTIAMKPSPAITAALVLLVCGAQSLPAIYRSMTCLKRR